MSDVNYRNFDLKIWRTEDGYRAQAQSTGGGEATCDFTLPFSEDKLENLIGKLGPARRVRTLHSPESDPARTLGDGLYKAVFTGEIGNSLSQNIEAARNKGELLRIRLRLTDVPELANMPWEFLYDQCSDRFLVLSHKTSIARYLELPTAIPLLSVKPPLRVLVMASSPIGYDSLDVKKELEKLQAAVDEMPRGLVTIERLGKATLGALHSRLSKGNQCHVFHFIGHGGFDPRTEKSVLVMEDEKRQASFVDGARLGVLLNNHSSIRLTVLNACQGATASPRDAFSGVAQGLIRQEVPAVIAMQFEITDPAAITFASGFYEAVARGNPIDAAVLNARLAIFAAENSLEWGTPVLYLRASDGRIFDTDLTEFESRIEVAPIPPVAAERPSEPDPRPQLVLPPIAPKGILPLQSAFYVERSADKAALELIRYTDQAITFSIQACGQMGASSLLRRVTDVARQVYKLVAQINFQQAFEDDDFKSSEEFHRRFCVLITDQLEIEDRVDQYWEANKKLSISHRCTKYARYILQSIGEKKLVLAMDEVDRLIDTNFRSSFFGMLRSWSMDEHFQQLDMVFVTSLALNQLIEDPNQSPFNTSGVIVLSDFTPGEIRRMSELYGIGATQAQIGALFNWISGCPYLWQLSLHQVGKEWFTIDELVTAAQNRLDPYIRYLSSWYEFLQSKPELRDCLINILKKREFDERRFLTLRRLGLVSRVGNQVRLRCELYDAFFREQFNVRKI